MHLQRAGDAGNLAERSSHKWTGEGMEEIEVYREQRVFYDVKAYVSCTGYVSIR